MPYTILHQRGQKRWCVVYRETKRPVPGGCHSRRQDAINHLVQLKRNVGEA